MNNSIQHFCQEGIVKLEKIMTDYAKDPTKIAEMVYSVTDMVTKLGTDIIAEEWENFDEIIRKSPERKKQGWYVKDRVETSLITSLGQVTYHKTLYHNKNTGEYEYLLDRAMGINPHERITEDAVARILEEAVETSYRKGGANASIRNDVVSKQTVKNKIHDLQFPDLKPLKKKQVKYLYIDADEDHVALQFMEHKGDISKGVNNTAMPKLAYVYEDVDAEDDRRKLMNCAYFGGVYEGAEGIKELWSKINGYIEASYDMDYLEKVFINGDGAAWIRSGRKYIEKSKFVLDKFHMHKYIIAATSHLKDSAEDARGEIYRAIHKRVKWMAEGVFDKIIEVTESESKQRAVEASKKYILGNWSGIMEQISNKSVKNECSAEGHISHIYADRMSSRPLGWSEVGVDKMSRLRVYHFNKGSMLELVRQQKKELPMAAGAEEVVLSCAEIYKAERQAKANAGNYADIPVYSIPKNIRKVLAIRHHLWDL